MQKCARKGGIGAVAVAAVCAMALSAAAQQERNVTTSKDRGDTVKVNVSGRVVLDYVWRSSEVTAFTDSFTNGVGTSKSEGTFEGYVAVRMDMELSDKVSAVVEFGTKRVDLAATPLNALNPWSTGDTQVLHLREASVRIGEFLMPELSAEFGISNWNFDVRGKGNSFALDPRHSQSILRNRIVTQDDDDALMARASTPDEQEPVGAVLTYSREAITLHLVALPTVIEAGHASDDESLYAIDFWYNLDQVGKGSRVGAVLALHGVGVPLADNLREGSMFTFGAGVVLKGLVDGLELYGEFYKNAGTAGQINAAQDDVDAAGLALQIGAEYRLPNNDMNIWFGVNFTMISGDDDTAPDEEANAFMGYENVGDLLILEDMYFGYDIDSNYTAVKIMGGLALSVGAGKNNLELSATLGFVNTTEDITGVLATDEEDALGTEIDVRAKWMLNKQVSINAAIAFLTGSDILESAMGGSAAPDSEDNAMLFAVGINAGF